MTSNAVHSLGAGRSISHCVITKWSSCFIFGQRTVMQAHLQPLNGLLAAWTEHDAIVKAGDGSGTAGQSWEGWRGAHPRHGIGHCGDIVILGHSLAALLLFLYSGMSVTEGRGMGREQEVRFGELTELKDNKMQEGRTERSKKQTWNRSDSDMACAEATAAPARRRGWNGTKIVAMQPSKA